MRLAMRPRFPVQRSLFSGRARRSDWRHLFRFLPSTVSVPPCWNGGRQKNVRRTIVSRVTRVMKRITRKNDVFSTGAPARVAYLVRLHLVRDERILAQLAPALGRSPRAAAHRLGSSGGDRVASARMPARAGRPGAAHPGTTRRRASVSMKHRSPLRTSRAAGTCASGRRLPGRVVGARDQARCDARLTTRRGEGVHGPRVPRAK